MGLPGVTLLQRRLIVIGRKGNIFPGRDFSLQSVQFFADQGVGIQASNRCAGGLGAATSCRIAFAALTGLPGCLPLISWRRLRSGSNTASLVADLALGAHQRAAGPIGTE